MEHNILRIRAGVAAESSYLIVEDRATWSEGHQWQHTNTLGDELIKTNRSLIPDRYDYLQPHISLPKLPSGHQEYAHLDSIEPENNNIDWGNRAVFTWSLSFQRNEFKYPGAAGYFECDLCAQFVRAAVDFNLIDGLHLEVTSPNVLLVGQAVVRWLMPGQRGVGVLRVGFLQAFRLLNYASNYIGFQVRATLNFADSSVVPPGPLQHGDNLRTDLNATLGVEYGRISLEGF